MLCDFDNGGLQSVVPVRRGFGFGHLVEHRGHFLPIIKVLPLVVEFQNHPDDLQDLCQTSFNVNVHSTYSFILQLNVSYLVHVNRELSEPLPGIFLLHHTRHMQAGWRRKETESVTQHVIHLFRSKTSNDVLGPAG